MNMDLMLPAALMAVAGIGVLRWSWSRKGRSLWLNLAGWGLLLLAAVVGGSQAGAWGVAVVSLVAMLAAALALAVAAATSPKGREKAAKRRVHMLPEAGEPLGFGRRLATFALVVLGGSSASIALGIALRVAALAVGWGEADANALALVSVPVTWGVIVTLLLMQERRRAQFLTLTAAAFPLLPAIFAGS